MMDIARLFYEEDSFLVFLLVTILLGGGASWLTGRAIAGTWRPWWQVLAYLLLLGFVVRFFHHALFGGTLLSAHYYIVDAAVCVLFGFWGYHATRARQMAQQYGWLYRRTGPVSFAAKSSAPNAAVRKSG